MNIKVVKMADFEAQHAAMYGESYTPVSMSGRSSPAMSHRLGSVDFSATGYHGLPLDMTPPSSATAPYFAMNMTTTDSPLSMTAAVDGMSFGMSSSSFGSQPATPERNASFSSISSIGSGHDFGTPVSPVGNMMPPSYPASIGSVSSVSSLAGPPTPDGAYPFPEVHSKSGLQGQQPLPSPYAQAHTRYPYHASHNASPFGNAGSDCSPSEFYWHTQGQQARPDSPAISYFGDRQSLPPPPPSVTLKSSIVKGEGVTDSYMSPMHDCDPRRSLSYSSAQMSAKALQNAVGSQSHSHSQYGYASMPVSDGIMVRRNGLEVSKIASGAYKCTVPGCPSRPFKRSEHLKRHITTHHENKEQFNCQFCPRQFNRKDNWRSHLKLHTAPRGKNARTDYYSEAVTLYTEEMRKVTKSRARKAGMH
ncbi:zinc finger protein odd-paired-like protein [Ophiostoma piceae UAMH 11346]|uniref:Zinc finger protein odd-paired-like protein n=1 Tax=Ophiostoma piceae (strain UAMH 11346) TaxID=1262450 RepID=S3CM80_OPHP1|nr:zinc finger protein odd-paired-like protein [Ophiostoma piceae UAMH 11346]